MKKNYLGQERHSRWKILELIPSPEMNCVSQKSEQESCFLSRPKLLKSLFSQSHDLYGACAKNLCEKQVQLASTKRAPPQGTYESLA